MVELRHDFFYDHRGVLYLTKKKQLCRMVFSHSVCSRNRYIISIVASNGNTFVSGASIEEAYTAYDLWMELYAKKTYIKWERRENGLFSLKDNSKYILNLYQAIKSNKIHITKLKSKRKRKIKSSPTLDSHLGDMRQQVLNIVELHYNQNGIISDEVRESVQHIIRQTHMYKRNGSF